MHKNTTSEGEGEEGDARARATGEPSTGDNMQWGVTGGAHFVAPTLASANLVRNIAGRALLPGEKLSAEDHQRLAMLVEAARPVVAAQPGLSWDEYEAWLKQGWVRPDGRRTFNTLPGALGWRLTAERIQGEAWTWACEQRGAQEPSEARGGREVPASRTQTHASVCGRHGTTLTGESRCLLCEREAAEEDRQREAAQAASDASGQDDVDYEDAPAPEEIDAADLAEMYRSMGTPPTDAWRATRQALEALRSGAAAEQEARAADQ